MHDMNIWRVRYYGYVDQDENTEDNEERYVIAEEIEDAAAWIRENHDDTAIFKSIEIVANDDEVTCMLTKAIELKANREKLPLDPLTTPDVSQANAGRNGGV